MRIKMPGLVQHRIDNITSNNDNENASSLSSSTEFWSNQSDDISYPQLQKFWSELPLHARKELLRIDKQTLFEHARKNMYCSRCNGLLLEGFLQIVMYGKSLQQDGAGASNKSGDLNNQKDDDGVSDGSQDEMPDPSVHPWGGLTTTRDGSLTLLGCYLCSKSLKGLQNVFDSARARERDREFVYPDACGGGGRGWISQGISSHGRGHGMRETCALHTTRISCETLVQFWEALGEETQHSLLRMKEEDFVEKLMYRFDNKRFCRDCRRNVIREFKELKELKRSRREPRCTSWFCGPDTAFLYEVSDDTVEADWYQTFADNIGTYHHFEWAVGTGEGKSDILEFENVGMNRSVRVCGLDLCGLSTCFISLRAWKLDGRCTELSVKAHALKGQQCVHCRLIVGDGHVSITSGEDITSFFEHAEEVEEEEDDDSIDKDGNDLDGECSRPQKHAKSPELAREFLLDAATIIFKEQVEKAFREGTARQNAHTMFVCLALTLLEERLHIACKEIITLEKQIKLLEEVEREKLVNEAKKERRRTKERERKQRRKERLRGKERGKGNSASEPNMVSAVSESNGEELLPVVEIGASNGLSSRDSGSETVDISPTGSVFPSNQNERLVGENVAIDLNMQIDSYEGPDGENNVKNGTRSTVEKSKSTNQGAKHPKSVQLDLTFKWSDRRWYSVVSDSCYVANRPEVRHHGETPCRSTTGSNYPLRVNGPKSGLRISGLKYSEKFHRSNNRMRDRYDSLACSCNQNNEYRAKVQPHATVTRPSREAKCVRKSDSAMDMSNKQFYRGSKYCQTESNETGGKPRNKFIIGNNSSRDSQSKKVWEPLESWKKKYPRSNSDSDITLRASAFKDERLEADSALINSSSDACSSELCGNSDYINCEDKNMKESRASILWKNTNSQNGLQVEEIDTCYPKEPTEDSIGMKDSILIAAHGRNTSNSDNCSSCLSEGDSNMVSSPGNTESSSTSDSEDTGQLSGQETMRCIQNDYSKYNDYRIEKRQNLNGEEASGNRTSSGSQKDGVVSSLPGGLPISSLPGGLPTQPSQHFGSEKDATLSCQPQGVLPQVQNPNLPLSMFQAPSGMSYYHEPSASWPTVPSSGFLPLPCTNNYVYTGPLGYDWNVNSNFCMHYGPVQSIVSPVPIYQPVPITTSMTPQENSQICQPGAEVQQVSRANAEKVAVGGRCAAEAPSRKKDVISNSSSAKQHDNNGDFSLFHYGGPVNLSTGGKSDRVPSEDEILNQTETTVQYNLFAASNGIKFSLF